MQSERERERDIEREREAESEREHTVGVCGLYIYYIKFAVGHTLYSARYIIIAFPYREMVSKIYIFI